MKVVHEDSASMVLRESSPGVAAMCLLFSITTIAQIYQMAALAEPEWFKITLLCLALAGLVAGGVTFARRTVVTLDQQSRRITIEISTLRDKQTHHLAFDDVKSITLQLNRVRNVQAGRYAVHTAGRTYPLSRSLSGNVDQVIAIVQKLRARVGLIEPTVDPEQAQQNLTSLTDESVLELVKSKQIVQATRVLAELKGLSTTSAQTG